MSTNISNNYSTAYSVASQLSDWMYSGSVSASEASYRTKTKEALKSSEMSQSSKDFMFSAKDNAENLLTALNSILGTGKDKTSSLNAITAKSSDTNKLSVKSVDGKKADIDAELNVQIGQVAIAQKNVGTALKANATTQISSGSKKLTIDVEGKSYTIDYSVSATDTNQKAQQKIADAINSKNIGVKASVSVDKDGNSTLALEAVATGVKSEDGVKFSVVSDTGNAAERTGIGTITQSAQNAYYKVNGGEWQQSQSNDVNVGNGVTATLKAETGTEGVNLKMGRDSSGAIKDVKSMVEAFNSLLSSAQSNKSDSRSNRLLSQLSSLSKSYGDALKRVGITVSGDGSMKIDEEKLQKAAEVGEFSEKSDLEKLFTSGVKGGSYGFANRLKNLASDVASNVTNYVSAKSSPTAKFSSIQSSTYNQYMGTSLFLDLMG